MQELPLRITVLHPPPGVAFGIQKGKSEVVPPDQVSSDSISFNFTVRVGARAKNEAPNFLGPFTQGPRSDRFVYVNSGKRAGQSKTPWDRRAKVPLTSITWAMIKNGGVLETRIEGIGGDGGPACGTVPLVGGWRVR